MPIRPCRIPFESLVDYSENRALKATAEQIQAHLSAACPTCRETLNWLANATPQIYAAQQTQVPAPVLNRAYDLLRQRTPVSARPAWHALLQFDTRGSGQLSGARGQSEGAFQLRFSAELHDITLFQEPMPDGAWYLIGQILPKEGDAVIVAQEIALTAQAGVTQTFFPQDEEFDLPGIAAGTYEMTIRLADGEITIPDVGVGAQEAP